MARASAVLSTLTKSIRRGASSVQPAKRHQAERGERSDGHSAASVSRRW
jgi:hypothetical protein